MFDRRLKLSNQVAEEAIEYFGDTVYQTKIPRNVRLSEAPSFGKPILLYDVECHAPGVTWSWPPRSSAPRTLAIFP